MGFLDYKWDSRVAIHLSRKKGNRNVLLLCVQIGIMRMVKGNTTILEGVLCYGNKNS